MTQNEGSPKPNNEIWRNVLVWVFNGAAKCSMDQPQRCRTCWGRTPPRATNSTRWRDVVCVLCRVIRPAAGGCRGIWIHLKSVATWRSGWPRGDLGGAVFEVVLNLTHPASQTYWISCAQHVLRALSFWINVKSVATWRSGWPRGDLGVRSVRGRPESDSSCESDFLISCAQHVLRALSFWLHVKSSGLRVMRWIRAAREACVPHLLYQCQWALRALHMSLCERGWTRARA